MEKKSILDVGPWTFDKRRIQNLLPSVETLNISPAVEGFGDLLPVLSSIDPHGLSKFLVLDFGPMTLNLGVRTFRILCSLVFSWTTFVKMRI